MIILDSSGWIEFFCDGPLKTSYEKYLSDPKVVVTPTIILYEVYKRIKRDTGETEGLRAVRYMTDTLLAPLTDSIALSAADFSIENSLPMAYAVIYATAFEYGCNIVTSDSHFEHLDNVIFIKKS